jgi:hypothetical protein
MMMMMMIMMMMMMMMMSVEQSVVLELRSATEGLRGNLP